ncbi:MAG: phospholipase D-like domain-containing protein, partial [Elusimicrobiota bacterium]
MRHSARVLLALALILPGPAWAQSVVAPSVRVPTVVAPVAGAAVSALSVSGSAPSLLLALPAPVPGLNAAALTPAAPAAAVARTASAVETPRTALEGLKTELDAPSRDPSDSAGSREQAARSFEAKLGIEAVVPAALIELTEGAFHHLGRVKTPPPAQAGDDGGGPTNSRPVAFNGERFPSVVFRPNEPVETHIVRAIESSRKSIQISLYEFTSRAILKALLAARKRGIKIEIILDDTSVNPRNEADAEYKRYRSEQIWALIRNGLDVTVIGRPTQYGINHHKFAVFDGKMVEFGSYNWTYTSERNHYENVLFSTAADRVKAYQDAWKHLRALSVSVAESATKDWPLDVPAPPSDTRKKISFNGTRLPAWIFSPAEL